MWQRTKIAGCSLCPAVCEFCEPKDGTRSELTRLDDEEPETIEQHRSDERKADTQEKAEHQM